MELPFTPQEYTVSMGSNNKTIELINGGEVNLIKSPKLTEYSFEFELATIGEKSEKTKPILDMIENAKMTKKILIFNILRQNANQTSFPLENRCSIEDFEISEIGEKFGRMKCSIKLKLFRPYRTQHLRDIKKFDEENAPTDKESTSCLKLLELLQDTNLRSGAGKHNRIVARMKKGEKPVAYAHFKFEGVIWYRIKHSKGDKGWAWISGTEKEVKILKDLKKEQSKITAVAEDVIGQPGHYTQITATTGSNRK